MSVLATKHLRSLRWGIKTADPLRGRLPRDDPRMHATAIFSRLVRHPENQDLAERCSGALTAFVVAMMHRPLSEAFEARRAEALRAVDELSALVATMASGGRSEGAAPHKRR